MSSERMNRDVDNRDVGTRTSGVPLEHDGENRDVSMNRDRFIMASPSNTSKKAPEKAPEVAVQAPSKAPEVAVLRAFVDRVDLKGRPVLNTRLGRWLVGKLLQDRNLKIFVGFTFLHELAQNTVLPWHPSIIRRNPH